MGKALTTTAGAALGLGLAVLGAMNASAATQFTVGDITVHYLGEVDTSFPLVSQPLGHEHEQSVYRTDHDGFTWHPALQCGLGSLRNNRHHP